MEKSIETIQHRGPDEEGFFLSPNCVLGMCRLAIIDVSDGQQPNYNQDKSVISVFNGEIYNFAQLRELLLSKGHRVGGIGDASLIPHLYEEFGSHFPSKLQGMFAIALYDSKLNKLILIRDRLGKKPLWYSNKGRAIYFSSEVKGLLALGIAKDFNRSVIPEFLRYGYINSPRSAFEGVNQLPPASILTYEGGKERIEEYWNPSNVEQIHISFEEAKEETFSLLQKAVATRLISERPIGAFLSGGIDSTIVTALMQRESTGPVNSYSIGFTDLKFDESRHAKLVANSIGSIHHEKIIEADPFLVIDSLARLIDHPFADSSIIPTFLLSKFARESVVVAISGDGGDESFAGYERYRVAKVLDGLNPLLVANPMQRLNLERISNQRIRKLLKHSRFQPLPNRYQGFQSLFQDQDLSSIVKPEILEGAHADHFMSVWNSIPTTDKIRKMQEVDIRTYLPGDLMYKVDLASMAVGLEVRSPFLDYRIVEFGLSLPSTFKIRGENKHILREIARDLVPAKLIDRPKMGFGIPRARWLREELRQIVRDVLLDSRCESRGWFEFEQLKKLIIRHDEGIDLDYLIWPMFMLELWAKNWID